LFVTEILRWKHSERARRDGSRARHLRGTKSKQRAENERRVGSVGAKEKKESFKKGKHQADAEFIGRGRLRCEKGGKQPKSFT